MIKLTCPWVENESAALRAALARANSKPLPRIEGKADRFYLTGPLPSDFKRSMMRGATRYQLDVNPHGCIFALSEVDGRSSSGYGGSCIPTPALVALLNLWASQQTGQKVTVQGELF